MNVFKHTVFVLPFLLFSCGEEIASTATIENENVALNGKELMEKNCYVCHNTQGTDNMLAPPMSRVRDHYVDDETTKDEFVSAIVAWCENPTEEASLMPGARRKFGLMPKQTFDSKEVEAIANYLFEEDSDLTNCTH